MKTILLLCAISLAAAGCGHLDLTPEGDPARVLSGEVTLGGGAEFPEGSIVAVRIIDASGGVLPPPVLGATTVKGSGPGPVAFRLEYNAEDEVLRRGLNVEVRVSIDGRVRYFNRNGHAVTLSNAADTLRIAVDPAGP